MYFPSNIFPFQISPSPFLIAFPFQSSTFLLLNFRPSQCLLLSLFSFLNFFLSQYFLLSISSLLNFLPSQSHFLSMDSCTKVFLFQTSTSPPLHYCWKCSNTLLVGPGWPDSHGRCIISYYYTNADTETIIYNYGCYSGIFHAGVRWVSESRKTGTEGGSNRMYK